MSFLDLTKKLDELKRDYKQQSMDLSKGYVVGSEVHKLAQAKLEENYQNSKTAILTQINRKLVKMEEKAKLEQEVHQNLTKPTVEDMAEGYKMIDVITKTAQVLNEDTLTKLVAKVKDMDQLAVINDVVASTNDIGLKNIVKNRIVELDSFDLERRDTLGLIEDFNRELEKSGGELTFNAMALATALDGNKEE